MTCRTLPHHPHKHLLLFLLLLIVTAYATWSFFHQTSTVAADEKTVRVFVLEYNPVLEDYGGKRLVEYKGWNTPTALESQYVADVATASNNSMNYSIAQRIVIDAIPTKNDGFTYTDATYLSCLSNPSTCHQPDTADYLKILTDYDVCGKRNRGEIDEVWLWGGPYFGYYESIMTGPNAFWTNGGPLLGSTCNKQLNIMGFNYERSTAEMLHDLGHRFEGTMRHVYGGWNMTNPQTPWDWFTVVDKDLSGKAGCGRVHFATNSLRDYDWGNTATVTSSCDDWLNYPNLTGTTTQISCQAWECSQHGYMKWWLNHIPKTSGTSNGILNNWWCYVSDYESAIAGQCGSLTSPTPSPTITPTPSVSPSPPPSPSPKPGKGHSKVPKK